MNDSGNNNNSITVSQSLYVDIHTHRSVVSSHYVSIRSVFLQEFQKQNTQELISIGLHPWHVSEVYQLKKIESDLRTILNENNTISAIGEIGLDRKCTSPFDAQIHVFELQLRIAQEFKKPIIVHCLKAFNEIMRMKKKNKIDVPIIIHGFNANSNILKEIIKNDFYVSIGEMGIKHLSLDTLLLIPTNRLFFETDNTNLDILKVYELYCKKTLFLLDDIKAKLYSNFIHVFGDLYSVKK